jgi:hypothetical protein
MGKIKDSVMYMVEARQIKSKCTNQRERAQGGRKYYNSRRRESGFQKMRAKTAIVELLKV